MVPDTTTGDHLMSKTNDTALAAFVARKADHFGSGPEDENWGDVGTLVDYRALLREITDMAFREGEHTGET